MNKVMKAISIVGNLSEVIIASSIVADLLLKLRGKKSATKTQPIAVDDANQPQTKSPDAAA